MLVLHTKRKREIKNPRLIKSNLYSDNTSINSEPSMLKKIISKLTYNRERSSGMTQTPSEKAFTAANKANIRGEHKRANKIRSTIYNMNREGFDMFAENLLDEGYDLSEITLQDLYEELETLDEKAVSEQQQKLFGLALSVKRGQTPRSEASDQVLKMVDSMSEKELRKFAKTKHEDVPVRVKEGISYEDLIKYIRKGENQ
jgi:hypothetical protein